MHPTQSPAPSSAADRPGRVTVFCAEDLRPTACCIVDALEVRGFEPRLRTGAAARKGLGRRRAMGLRVVLSPEELDPDVHARIVGRLDPEGRGDVMLLPCDTPRQVIEAIGERLRRDTTPPSRRRTERVFLAHPTLVESSVAPARARRLTATATLAAAAATALLVLSPEVVDGAQTLFGVVVDGNAQLSMLGTPALPPASTLEFDESELQPTSRASDLTLASAQPRFGAQPLTKRYDRRHDVTFDDLDDLDDRDDLEALALPEPTPGRSHAWSPPPPPWHGTAKGSLTDAEASSALLTTPPPPPLTGPIESYGPPAVEPAPLEPVAVAGLIPASVTTGPEGYAVASAGDSASGLADANAIAVVALPSAAADGGIPHGPYMRDSLTLEVEDVLLDAPRPRPSSPVTPPVTHNAVTTTDVPETVTEIGASTSVTPPLRRTADPFARATVTDPVAITAPPTPRTADPFADIP